MKSVTDGGKGVDLYDLLSHSVRDTQYSLQYPGVSMSDSILAESGAEHDEIDVHHGMDELHYNHSVEVAFDTGSHELTTLDIGMDASSLQSDC